MGFQSPSFLRLELFLPLQAMLFNFSLSCFGLLQPPVVCGPWTPSGWSASPPADAWWLSGHRGGDSEAYVSSLTGLDLPWVSWLNCLISVPGLVLYPLSFPISFNFYGSLWSKYLIDKETSLEVINFSWLFVFVHLTPNLIFKILYYLYSTLIDNRDLKNHTFKLLYLGK